MADSGATENMTQDSSNLEDYTPAPCRRRGRKRRRDFSPVAGYGRLGLLVDQNNGIFHGATRELTLDRVAHAPTPRVPQPAFSKTTHNSIRRADAPLSNHRHHLTPFRAQDDRFPLPTPRNWPPRNQGPPSHQYKGAASATNGSAIGGDGQGEPSSHHGVP